MIHGFNKDACVSIIIPTFNSERGLVRALESIRQQTFHDYEVIVIDDCSIDNTCVAVEDFIRGKLNYRLLRLPANGGAGAARSAGLRLASGRYIAFLDSDDFWEPKKLERQISYLEKNPNVIIVHCGYNILSHDLNLLGVFKPPSEVDLFKMHFSNFIATSTSIFRADLIGAESMPLIRARQDYAFWLKLLRANKGKVVGLPDVLCNYVRMPGSVSSSPLMNLKYNYVMFNSVCNYPAIFSAGLVFLNACFRMMKSVRSRAAKLLSF